MVNHHDQELAFKVKKYLVWQAIDEYGNFSKAHIGTAAINGTTYLKITKTILYPIIIKHHNTEDILFWPDMAPAHYYREVIEWLDLKGIQYVPKKDNAPNVPQARPIERYLALTKQEYKKVRKETKTIRLFSIQ